MEDTGTRGKDARVMLVDDDPVILNLLSTGLTRAGYRVEACREAGGALESYRGEPPDVAVLDVGLPDMPGTDLARELLRAEYRPILILSSHNDLEIVQQAITSGVVGYLVKPLSVEQLIPSIETSLSSHRARRARIATHVAGDGAAPDQLAEVMDHFPFGLIVVDDQHHPIYRNATARRLLEDGVLGIDPAGRLRTASSNRAFIPVLDQALGRASQCQWGAVRLGDAPGRLHAWAAPLSRDPNEEGERLAAVAVFDNQRGNDYGWDALKTLYGLTRKETRLVNGLLEGQTLDEYCERNFVTANTVRTHLKSVYRKTGTNRQAELVRLFSSMFMPAA